MPLRVPPPEIPIVKWLSPNKADQGLLEFWNTEVASYVPLDIGSAHPNTRLYPGFTLGKQSPLQGDEKWVARIWVTPETSPEWFNYAEKFSAEDNAYPIFIRTYRELKSTYQPRAKQSSLGAFYKLVLDNPGSGFTNGTLPEVTFDSESPTPAIAHGVVAADGTLAECVLDFCGEGFTENIKFTVDAPANGNPASGTAYVQPVTAILVREEANQYPEDSEFYAQYLQVVRIYETLPGPTLFSTKLDIDGATLTTGTTRKLCADIVTGEDISGGVWTKTTKRQTDIDFVCEEVVETRAIPGNVMESTKIDEDGKVITRTQQYVDSTTIVSSETIVTGNWIRKFEEEVDGTNVVSWQVVETRPVPGNPIVEDKIDDDGKLIATVRTLKDFTTITHQEQLTGGFWIKTESKAVSDLVSWEIVTARAVPGNVVPSATIDGDHEVATTERILRDESLITPSATESGGFITAVEKKEVSDLVANQITTVTKFLDKAVYSVRIPESIIPLEFRANIPTVTEVHVVAGTAAMPTLLAGEFFREERQLTEILKSITVESLGGISFPVVQHGQENSTEYGGSILDVERTLDDSALTADEGEDIVSSVVNPIGDNLMWFKETKKRPSTDAEWPTILSDYFDKEMQVKALVEEQVVDPGYTEATGTYFIESLKGIDKWRSRRTKLTREPTAISLATALIEEVDGPFQFPGILYYPTVFSGGVYVRRASAQLCQQILRTWWLSSPTKPTRGLPGSGADVEVQDIIMEDIVINELNDVSRLAYSGMILHDDITVFGTEFYAETTPNATDYMAMIGTEIVVAASIEPTEIPELWKIQTKSVIAR